jgi:hypothetical protein
MSRRNLVLVAAVVAVAVAVAVALLVGRQQGGQPTPQRAVAEYLAALRARDGGRMNRVAEPGHDASREIPDRVRRLGGGRFVVVSTQISDTASDHEKNATLTGTVAGAPYVDSVWLDRHGSRWYVVLGPNRNAHPKGTGA